MNTDIPRILSLYSAKSDLPQQRIENEHKAIEQVLQDLHVDSSLICRLNVTTTEDLTNALLERDYEIVQLSGLGSKEGFLLEDLALGEKEYFISARQIAKILHESSPKLKVAVFMSCYMADSIPELVSAAPSIITVINPVEDNSESIFISQFYKSYLQKGSIERAFNTARNYVEMVNKDSGLISILSRRAEVVKSENQVLYQAFPSGRDYSILIDLTEAEKDIASLNVSRDSFLEVLSRKIRVHKWIFNSPRQKVVLSLGPYFGLFSWKDADDIVTCHRILRIKHNIEESTSEAWASLIVTYNNHYMDRHRTSPVSHASMLINSLDEYRKTYTSFFSTGEKASVFRNVTPEQFKVTKAVISANLDMAEKKFQLEDYDSVVIYIETILSAIHDLLDNLTDLLTI